MDLEVEEHDLLLKITLETCNADDRALEVVFMPLTCAKSWMHSRFLSRHPSTRIYMRTSLHSSSLVLSRRSLRDPSTTLAPKRGVALVETAETWVNFAKISTGRHGTSGPRGHAEAISQPKYLN